MLYKKSIAKVLSKKLFIKTKPTVAEKNICPRCNSHQTTSAGFKKGVRHHRCKLCFQMFPSNGKTISKKIEITKILN